MNNNFFTSLKRWFTFGGRATGQTTGDQVGVPATYNGDLASSVSEDTALQVSTIFACVRLVAEVFSSLPVGIYERHTPGAVPVTVGTINQLLQFSPNRHMTKIEFFENMQLNLLLHGNCYARLQRNKLGQVINMWPLPAQNTTPVLMADGSVVYHYFHNNDVTVIADNNMLHVRLFGNGLVGLSPLAYARNTVGLAQASDNYATKYFVRGGKPSGILHTDQDLTKTQRQAARKNFAEIVEEREEQDRLLVLPLGFKYQGVQISPADMQLLESRRFGAVELCRFFGNVPGPLVGVMSESSVWGSGIEQMFLAWHRTGLNPFASRWEQALERKLLTPVQRMRYKVDFQFDHLMRGDTNTLTDMIQKSVGGPVMTPNEGREKLNLPPVTDGNTLNKPANETTKDKDKEKEHEA